MRPVLLAVMFLTSTAAFADTLVYFGTYTKGKNATSEGVYVSTLDENSGYLSAPKLAAKLTNPSFVAIHPNGKFLYAVSEVFTDGGKTGGVVAFSINEDGTLTKLNEQSTGGAGACHVAVDPTGKCVAAANYGGESCASFPVNDDGSLGKRASFHQHTEGSGVVERRQKDPHAHSVNFNADGTQAFVADLGKDQIVIYNVDTATGTMKPAQQPHVSLKAGGGPRHFSFHPTHQWAYSNLEISSELTALHYNAADKTMEPLQVVSTLPANAEGRDKNSTAECLVHPSGRFVYVSNRGHNSIAVFAIDAQSGLVTHVENESTQGEIPRGFGIDPTGKYLIVGNQNSANVVSLKIDEQTGALSPTGHGLTIGSPVNVRFLQR